jgi:hypothetical protein
VHALAEVAYFSWGAARLNFLSWFCSGKVDLETGALGDLYDHYRFYPEFLD